MTMPSPSQRFKWEERFDEVFETFGHTEDGCEILKSLVSKELERVVRAMLVDQHIHHCEQSAAREEQIRRAKGLGINLE